MRSILKLGASLVLSLTVLLATADDAVLQKVSLALKTGNASEVSKHFDSNVELTILDDDGAYSKAQAEQVLKDFFAKNKVSGFELIHKGSSAKGSKYGIGKLTTSNGTFRTYFYLKQKGTEFVVQELRFERE